MLTHSNQVKPRELNKISIKKLADQGKHEELNEIIQNISEENFEENGIFANLMKDYFDFKKDELKLVNTFQILSQYMLYSNEHLKKKNKYLKDLIDKQTFYIDEADKLANKQVFSKIKLTFRKFTSNNIEKKMKILIII